MILVEIETNQTETGRERMKEKKKEEKINNDDVSRQHTRNVFFFILIRFILSWFDASMKVNVWFVLFDWHTDTDVALANDDTKNITISSTIIWSHSRGCHCSIFSFGIPLVLSFNVH